MEKRINQICYHEKTKTFFRVTKHGDYLTHVQKIKNILPDEKLTILPVHALLHTNELHFYPWIIGDK